MVPIGEAARRSGVHVETIRYYERIGLIAPPGRDAGGRRLFAPREVARLRFIHRCRDLGFSLDDIRALLGLSGRAASECASAQRIGRAQLARIRERQRELARLERALEELVAQCEEGRPACPMLERLMAGRSAPDR